MTEGATGICLPVFFVNELAPGEPETEELEHKVLTAEKVQLAYPKLVTVYNGTKWTIGKR